MENQINFNPEFNMLSKESEFSNKIKIENNSEIIHKNKSIRSKNRYKPLKRKSQIKNEQKKIKISQSDMLQKQQIKFKTDIKNIFKSSQFINHNLKSLEKELKINDTIVAIISTLIILLSFIQVINKKRRKNF